MLLAIDTATQTLSIAVHDGTDVLCEQTWRTQNRHTTELAPAVDHALALAGRPPLTAVAVAIGPGTYSGVRVGVAFAKGLALTFNLPLVGLNTLDILAAGQPPAQGGLVAVLQAGRNRIVAAAYQQRSKRWKARHTPESTTWDALIASFDGPVQVTGEIDAAGRELLEAARTAGAAIAVAPPPLRLRRAAWLAEEAWARLRDDADRLIVEAYDPVSVSPIYVKTRDLP